ncbi:MAG: PRC-barrel domain-containing protein [Acidimicrobiales bacterium]
MKINVGMLAEATDGPCGEVADVVLDPVNWHVTHLVVQPHHQHDEARLVPIDAVISTDADHVVLSWSTTQVEAAAVVEVTDFLSYDTWPRIEGGWDVGSSRVLAWPYYPFGGFGMGGVGFPYNYGGGYGGGGPARVSTAYDRVPDGTIEVRRASQVLSSDGHKVGHVDGFLIDANSKITHLVLEHGHLWGHRDITIPIVDVERASRDEVELRVTRDAVGEYPSVPFHRHGQAA